MRNYLFSFRETDKTMTARVGGKGANLGELTRIEGIHVPDGFTISTEAYRKILEENSSLTKLLDQLSLLKTADSKKIRELSREIRRIIEGIMIPVDLQEAIKTSITALGIEDAYAVRSSATAEDLPAASFAGQQDSYLNIIGIAAILKHISKCWASLFTERAIIYRIQNGFDHRKVQLAVIIQRMVFPQASGILFTADPVSSNRKVLSIDAGFGLGEAMVSGLVNSDNYKVQGGRITARKISAKKMAVYALKNGGTKEKKIEAGKQDKQVLTDKQILALETAGRKIEEHFGSPQDIEWCLADDTFYIVQSRPITTLFPVPKPKDNENHVYVSVGHAQMMTDAFKPLGLSFWLLTTRAPMPVAGGRLFVDVTAPLASPESRKKLLDTFGHSDTLIKDALTVISKRKGFFRTVPENPVKNPFYVDNVMPWSYLEKYENNPSLVPDLINSTQNYIESIKQNISKQSGTGVFDFILESINESKTNQFNPQSLEVIKIALYASAWINRRMMKWLGAKNAADVLSQSVEYNITAEMGLALLDVADVIRPFPEVITYLQQTKDDHFLVHLDKYTGGNESRLAIENFLNRFGMRCAGEIDITKTRWSEKPITLVPSMLNNIKNLEPGAAKKKFSQGLKEALQKEQELLNELKKLPGGKRKANETKRMISLLRNFIGYREYPKYAMINRFFIYKQALMQEAEQLVERNVIREKEDVYYLSFEEFRELVHSGKPDNEIIHKRKEEFNAYEKITPPRVFTSDGEVIQGSYKKRDLPADALAGLAVSSGVIEGRARVILKMEDAELEDGDILVTVFTDPSWTPLFVLIKGLVTEVGGLMTHGAVIAREYGLPAVVGVEKATKLIKDGQRIRVNGTDGYVEIL